MALRYSRLLVSSSTSRIESASLLMVPSPAMGRFIVFSSGCHAGRSMAGGVVGARALDRLAGAEIAQLGDGAQLELAHALAADAELLAERAQRHRARAHVAGLEDGALARVELL